MPTRKRTSRTSAAPPVDAATAGESADFHRAQLRTEELRSQIAYHEHRYFVLDSSGGQPERV